MATSREAAAVFAACLDEQTAGFIASADAPNAILDATPETLPPVDVPLSMKDLNELFEWTRNVYAYRGLRVPEEVDFLIVAAASEVEIALRRHKDLLAAGIYFGRSCAVCQFLRHLRYMVKPLHMTDAEYARIYGALDRRLRYGPHYIQRCVHKLLDVLVNSHVSEALREH